MSAGEITKEALEAAGRAEDAMRAAARGEKITEDMRISRLIQEHPEAVEALYESGMGCVGCPAAQMETLKEAAYVHGLDPDEVLYAVNERINSGS